MKPAIPIYDRRFVYVPAATHIGNPNAFALRQEARRVAAQTKPANVASIRAKKKERA